MCMLKIRVKISYIETSIHGNIYLCARPCETLPKFRSIEVYDRNSNYICADPTVFSLLGILMRIKLKYILKYSRQLF